MNKKVILHLCADIGSDSRAYQIDSAYEVIMIGKGIGVENYSPPLNVHGIIANPVCTEFSTAQSFCHIGDMDKGMFLVNQCIRIIKEANPMWWVIENPANGRLCEVIGKPKHTYQPWQYGTPWTKKTALWGDFIMPLPLYKNYADVPKIEGLYLRPGRKKVGLYQLHKNAIANVSEFQWCKHLIKNDADLRSLCSQGFANEFKKHNP